jgi:uncharacterized SAM-binding protein YcdF (DUF218 family)
MGRARQSRARRWFRRLGIAIGVVIVACGLLYLVRIPLLRGVGSYLIVEDSLERADLIFITGGGPESRPFRAAELYRAGYAPRIATPMVETSPIVTLGVRPPSAVENAWVLQRLGVPDSAIRLLKWRDGATSTLDDARVLATYIKQKHYRRVIVVTSDFHTRRTRWAVRQFVPDSIDVRMAPADSHNFGPDDWWRTEDGLIAVMEEFFKFVHNFTQR